MSRISSTVKVFVFMFFFCFVVFCLTEKLVSECQELLTLYNTFLKIEECTMFPSKKNLNNKLFSFFSFFFFNFDL